MNSLKTICSENSNKRNIQQRHAEQGFIKLWSTKWTMQTNLSSRNDNDSAFGPLSEGFISQKLNLQIKNRPELTV